MTKRHFLFSLLGGLGAAVGAKPLAAALSAGAPFEIEKPADEWRRLLTPEQFHVLREHGTEPAGTSPLNHEQRQGTYSCAACELPLYGANTKYDSGTGWPSFYEPLTNAIGTSVDRRLFTVRTEVHCRRCGGHLGHVFDDGPPPTGLRYCMNGVALTFRPDRQPLP